MHGVRVAVRHGAMLPSNHGSQKPWPAASDSRAHDQPWIRPLQRRPGTNHSAMDSAPGYFWCRSLRWELHGILNGFALYLFDLTEKAAFLGCSYLLERTSGSKWLQVAASLEVVGRSFDIPFIRLRILANRSGKQKANST